MIVTPLMLLTWGTASAQLCVYGFVRAECEGGEHVLSATAFPTCGPVPPDLRMHFKREAIGICYPADFVPAEPVPVPAEVDPITGQHELEVRVPALTADFFFRYTPYFVTADGGYTEAYFVCDTEYRSSDIVVCGEAPMARARLVRHNGLHGFYYSFEFCESGCWTEFMDPRVDREEAEDLSGLDISELVGRTIDIFGDRRHCAMVGGFHHVITRLELVADDDCSRSLPTLHRSWGSFKATYR